MSNVRLLPSQQRESILVVKMGTPDWPNRVGRAFSGRNNIIVRIENEHLMGHFRSRAQLIVNRPLPCWPAPPVAIPVGGIPVAGASTPKERLAYILSLDGEFPPPPPGAAHLINCIKCHFGEGRFYRPEIKLNWKPPFTLNIYFIFN